MCFSCVGIVHTLCWFEHFAVDFRELHPCELCAVLFQVIRTSACNRRTAETSRYHETQARRQPPCHGFKCKVRIKSICRNGVLAHFLRTEIQCAGILARCVVTKKLAKQLSTTWSQSLQCLTNSSGPFLYYFALLDLPKLK